MRWPIEIRNRQSNTYRQEWPQATYRQDTQWKRTYVRRQIDTK